ncbi:hypothetical protein AVEN_185140-1 [Araneus ventricosus]|uniref:Uncharacterized protein n=1 Tax=Araneus ventricosus TaxID=182803 RepID=A0A4Y2KZS9_ARAVE|nr:hypothetical protein AVEN_185140-1 [Araneus ventricosus]
MLSSLEYRKHSWHICVELQSDCRLSWFPSRLHKVLLPSVPVGQQGQKKALRQEAHHVVLTSELREHVRKPRDCIHFQQPPLHIKLGLMKNFVKWSVEEMYFSTYV